MGILWKLCYAEHCDGCRSTHTCHSREGRNLVFNVKNNSYILCACMNKPLVLYHKGCPDGFTGAWVAWMKFGDSAEYLGLEHQVAPPKALAGRDLIFIDFCYPLPVMKKIMKIATRVTILDHHESQVDAIHLATEYVYNPNHSGCGIAWGYFFPKKKVPKMLLAIEDSDLFIFKYKDTKYISAFLGAYDMDFSVWKVLMKDFENTKKRKKYCEQGKIILTGKSKAVEKNLLRNGEEVMFEGYHVVAVNTSLYYSEAGSQIYKRWSGVPFGITWYYKDGKIHASLRSDTKVDVSLLAVKFGGGGHPGAAGFSFPFRGTFPWKPAKQKKFLI